MAEYTAPIRPIFVLGVDRSGTSLVSELLSRWGAYGGETEHLPEGDAGNPLGYWEYGPMEDFGGDLMASVGLSAWDPEFQSQVRQKASDPEWHQRALELVAGMTASDRPWFWKEPEFVLVLPFWLEILTDPVYLITLRNPCESAFSYEKFFLPSILAGKIRLTGFFFLRWQYFMTSICEQVKNSKSKIFISYEALVASPQEQCKRISRFLSAEFGTQDGEAEIGERMAQAINPDFWRNRSPIPFDAAVEASVAQKEFYSYLSNRLDGDLSDFDASDFPFPEVWREYLSNIEILRWLLKSL